MGGERRVKSEGMWEVKAKGEEWGVWEVRVKGEEGGRVGGKGEG